MSFSSSGKGRLSEINVTPFVDVVLVLLVIFMVTAPMLQTGMQVDLPKATLDSIPVDNRPIIVTLTKDKSIWLNDTRFSEKEVVNKLMPVLKKKAAGKTIYLRADRSLPYGNVARFVALLHAAGIRKVSLVTEPESG